MSSHLQEHLPEQDESQRSTLSPGSLQELMDGAGAEPHHSRGLFPSSFPLLRLNYSS